MKITVFEHLHVALFTVAVIILIKFGLKHLAGGAYSHYTEDL